MIARRLRVRIWKPVTVQVTSQHLLGVTEERHELFQLWWSVFRWILECHPPPPPRPQEIISKIIVGAILFSFVSTTHLNVKVDGISWAQFALVLVSLSQKRATVSLNSGNDLTHRFMWFALNAGARPDGGYHRCCKATDDATHPAVLLSAKCRRYSAYKGLTL